MPTELPENYQERQDVLNGQWQQANETAKAYYEAGEELPPQMLASEYERARIAGQEGNANWAHRTPSPMTAEQYGANEGAAAQIRSMASMFRSMDKYFGAK